MPKILGSRKHMPVSETRLGYKGCSLPLFLFSHLHLHNLEKFGIHSIGPVIRSSGMAQSLLFCGLTVLRNKAETLLKHLTWDFNDLVDILGKNESLSLCFLVFPQIILNYSSTFTFCQQLLGLVLCYFPCPVFVSILTWFIKITHKEQDFWRGFLLTSGMFVAQDDGILPQISGGEISELLECALPVNRHAAFLNPPIFNPANFKCRYWLDRKNRTSCFFKMSTSSCLKKWTCCSEIREVL